MQRRLSPFAVFVGLLLVLFCLSGLGVFWSIQQLPRWAAEQFGQPAPYLTQWDRLTYSVRLLMNRDDLLTPLNATGTERQFEVGLGESVTDITTRLQQQGLVRNAEALRLYLIYAGLDTSVQAGQYTLSPAMNAVQIGYALQDATPAEVTFAILPGWRAEEIAAALPTSGLSITPEEFLDRVHHPAAESLPEGWAELTSLEGFLFPGSYEVSRDLSLQDLIATFLKQWDGAVNADMRQAFERQGLSLEQAVTLASMVQREAVVAEEQPLIASVFYNRLNAGMKLESDPTVQYALGYNDDQGTWWTNPLSLQDLEIQSPYNTYLVVGLPPTPIANPGLSALEAVAYPAQTPYYYFRARCDGSGQHVFAATFEEHLQNSCP